MTISTLPTTIDRPTDHEIHIQIDAAPRPEQLAKERIAELAYGLYLARGGQDGHDIDDWLEAERRFVNESLAP